jgi:hypothetical protein
MLDSVFTLLSLQHELCVQYILSQFVFGLSCIVQPTFPDMFHIHLSMDECWINEMYMYVCMYVCMYVQDCGLQTQPIFMFVVFICGATLKGKCTGMTLLHC